MAPPRSSTGGEPCSGGISGRSSRPSAPQGCPSACSPAASAVGPLVAAHCDRVVLSLDGRIRDVPRRGRGWLRAAMAGLAALRAVAPDLRIEARVTVTASNAHALVEIADRSAGLGFDGVSWLPTPRPLARWAAGAALPSGRRPRRAPGPLDRLLIPAGAGRSSTATTPWSGSTATTLPRRGWRRPRRPAAMPPTSLFVTADPGCGRASSCRRMARRGAARRRAARRPGPAGRPRRRGAPGPAPAASAGRGWPDPPGRALGTRCTSFVNPRARPPTAACRCRSSSPPGVPADCTFERATPTSTPARSVAREDAVARDPARTLVMVTVMPGHSSARPPWCRALKRRFPRDGRLGGT